VLIYSSKYNLAIAQNILNDVVFQALLQQHPTFPKKAGPVLSNFFPHILLSQILTPVEVLSISKELKHRKTDLQLCHRAFYRLLPYTKVSTVKLLCCLVRALLYSFKNVKL